MVTTAFVVLVVGGFIAISQLAHDDSDETDSGPCAAVTSLEDL